MISLEPIRIDLAMREAGSRLICALFFRGLLQKYPTL
jgi:hypothetical protein